MIGEEMSIEHLKAIKDYLKMLVEVQDSMPRKFMLPDAFVLKHGVSYDTISPTKVKRGKMGLCYENSFRLADSNPDLTYVEGYSYYIIPLGHAWCIDNQGRIVEPTWTGGWIKDAKQGDRRPMPGSAYFGVPISTDYVRKVRLASGFSGVIHNWQSKGMILKETTECWKPRP